MSYSEKRLVFTEGEVSSVSLPIDGELPSSIRLPHNLSELFEGLPKELRMQLLDGHLESKTEKESPLSPEEIIDCLDSEDRADFFRQALFKLVNLRLFNFAAKSDVSHESVSNFVRFMDLVWDNRGLSRSDMQILNQVYLDRSIEEIKVEEKRVSEKEKIDEELRKFRDKKN